MIKQNTHVEFLSSFVTLSDDMLEEFKSISEFKKIKAGTQLVKHNEIPSKIYMLVKGIVRCYLITESGKEFNKTFYLPIGFVGSLTALLRKKPSIFIFETLTECRLYEIDYYKLMDLCKRNTSINGLYTKVLEIVYVKYEKRLIELMTLDATQRYIALKEQIPNIDDIIPQYHIASYLGITAVQLSRIRKKLE